MSELKISLLELHRHSMRNQDQARGRDMVFTAMAKQQQGNLDRDQFDFMLPKTKPLQITYEHVTYMCK